MVLATTTRARWAFHSLAASPESTMRWKHETYVSRASATCSSKRMKHCDCPGTWVNTGGAFPPGLLDNQSWAYGGRSDAHRDRTEYDHGAREHYATPRNARSISVTAPRPPPQTSLLLCAATPVLQSAKDIPWINGCRCRPSPRTISRCVNGVLHIALVRALNLTGQRFAGRRTERVTSSIVDPIAAERCRVEHVPMS